ncbi:MAG: undecaprenyldiphospho-muramoylpentapeptide beta-N-acetylglucosaminyltransferase [Betaproteobacteria bacterium]|nr:undecaprenyldiphospho-muramoylpentapeptide beta-N-acetylglucosaminyltransferase [Betaproteobacteria bacterium]NBT74754.1 undecaprenyldiphospho-muramoylpentapeptide beta-N-acetylglucosaminyltransferase [Betaproteobacteria bacterium]NBY14576.1 undecaprenyldiphospho-muramoylpentapeptide beta-N-acetylglucosaminyltransferase [Betaproteobacteria bacterium]
MSIPALERLCIASGGTGGHIFPALAFAERLRSESAHPVWLGTNRGLELRVTRAAGIPFHALAFEGVRGRGLRAWVMLPLRLLHALWQALSILRAERPQVVVTFGGYVSFPVGLAARLLGHPLVIHEQNAVMGSANRWLAKIANRVAVSFPQTRFAPAESGVTGNPVRASLTSLAPASERIQARTGVPRVLVIGGSLGARPLNEAMPQALHSALASGVRWEIWHQTGPAEQGVTAQRYADHHLTARVDAFIEDMSEAYLWADLVVCRAGASTVTELMALGQPALFVPLPHAIDDHQTANARAMTTSGGARMVPQSEHLAGDLARELMALDRATLLDLARLAERQRDVHACERLVELVKDAMT